MINCRIRIFLYSLFGEEEITVKIKAPANVSNLRHLQALICIMYIMGKILLL